MLTRNFLAAVFFLFAGACVAQDTLPYSASQPGFYKPTLELARFCLANNLFSQGKELRDEVINGGGEDAAAAQKLSEEFDLSKPDVYTARAWGDYLDKREDIQKRRAAGVMKAMGASGYQAALEFYPESAEARKAGGYVHVDGLGWCKPAEAERLKPYIVQTKDAPKTNDRTATWAQPYVMVGAHFTLITDLPWWRALRYSKILDRFYEIFYEVTGEYLPQRKNVNLVWVCAKAKDFIVQSNDFSFAMTDKHEGAYMRWHGFSLINAERADEVGRLNKAKDNLARTLFHEGVHRLAEVSACGTMQAADAWSNYAEQHGWIVEAIAVIFENLEVKDKGYTLTSLEAQRKWSLDKMKKEGRTASLAAIFPQTTQEFGTNAPIHVADKYAVAGSVAWYCVFVKKDQYKAAFYALLIDQYRGASKTRDFASRFGLKLEEFEKAWKSYALGK